MTRGAASTSALSAARNSEEIAACEEAGIVANVPKPLTPYARAEGRFDRSDFVYECESDSYVCPAGEKLTIG